MINQINNTKMKTQKFISAFALVFVLAFVSCMFATMGWNLLSAGAASVDWEKCFLLATIIAFSNGFADFARQQRKNSHA